MESQNEDTPWSDPKYCSAFDNYSFAYTLLSSLTELSPDLVIPRSLDTPNSLKCHQNRLESFYCPVNC